MICPPIAAMNSSGVCGGIVTPAPPSQRLLLMSTPLALPSTGMP